MTGARIAAWQVFIDTSAYFAAVDKRSPVHEQAARFLTQLTSEGVKLVTTNFVVAEVHALLLTRISRAVAARVLNEIDRSRSTSVVRANVVDEARAREIINQYVDKDFTLTDAISFAVMERFNITHAFALDHHFAQYGWIMLPTPE